jgi:hypothetical protein
MKNISTLFLCLVVINALTLIATSVNAQVNIPFYDDFELAEFDTTAWRLRPNL